jgi:hypothetical protein
MPFRASRLRVLRRPAPTGARAPLVTTSSRRASRQAPAKSTLLALLALAAPAAAPSFASGPADPPASPDGGTRAVVFDGDLDLGYRTGRFDWNIAGTPQGTEPNILSELKWRDAHIWELRAQGELLIREHLWIGGNVLRGTIRSGTSYDTDYAGDNRTFEFSQSVSDSRGGDVKEGDIGIGYRWLFPRRSGAPPVGLIVSTGYGIHKQDWRMRDGVQLFSDEVVAGEPLPPVGPFPGLDSHYRADWRGSWLGAEVRVPLSRVQGLYGLVRVHWPDYKGEATWNLRDDLAQPRSFEHSANGRGLVVSAGWRHAIAPALAVHLALDLEKWTTSAGRDRTFFSDGTTYDTRLNEVNWKTAALSAGISLRP